MNHNSWYSLDGNIPTIIDRNWCQRYGQHAKNRKKQVVHFMRIISMFLSYAASIMIYSCLGQACQIFNFFILQLKTYFHWGPDTTSRVGKGIFEIEKRIDFRGGWYFVATFMVNITKLSVPSVTTLPIFTFYFTILNDNWVKSRLVTHPCVVFSLHLHSKKFLKIPKTLH